MGQKEFEGKIAFWQIIIGIASTVGAAIMLWTASTLINIKGDVQVVKEVVKQNKEDIKDIKKNLTNHLFNHHRK